MNNIEEAKELIETFKETWNENVDKLTDDQIEQLSPLANTDDDINFLNRCENEADAESVKGRIEKIKSRYFTANLCIGAIAANYNQEAKTEDDFDIKEEKNIEEKPEEEDVFYDKNELMVVETADGKKQAKKGRMFWKVLGITAAVGAIAITLTKIGSCVSNRNTVTTADDNNEPTIEQTTNNITTTADVTVTTDNTVTETTVVEPEVSIDELIAEAVENYEPGEGTISKEQYEFMLNYTNNNLNEDITEDLVVQNVMNPIYETLFNELLESLSTANGAYDEGYDTGSFKVSDLVLEDSISKEKLLELDALKDALKSNDPELKNKAAEQVLYILYVINNQVNNSNDTIIISGKEYTGNEINGVQFGKYYQPEFYELNDSSDQFIYLTYLNVLSHNANLILPEGTWIGAQEYLIGDDGEKIPVQSKETFDTILYDIYTGSCETDEVNQGFTYNLYTSVLNASVKENRNTLGIKGYVVEEPTLTLTPNNN